MSRWAESGRVLRAFAYLRATSFVNAVRSKLKRLRQPKYLVGALVMGGYVAMMFSGWVFAPDRHGFSPPPEIFALLAGAAALVLFVFVATAWLLPGDRAALAFSEAEVAFLFPAPMSRVALINFSLLRSQLAILLSAFLLSVVFGRGRGLPGSAWQHAIALWLAMATLRLHFLGASFAHERLFEAGWAPWLRRVAGAVLLLAMVGGVVAWLAASVRPPGEDDFASGETIAAWLLPVLATPPASVVLAPFRWLVAPLFAGGGPGWWMSLPPAFALLGLHYLWVIRSHVAFEEASMEKARRSALRAQAWREGRSGLMVQRTATVQRPPFSLAARGSAPVAFLWQGLIAAGPVARPRTALLAIAVAAAIAFGLAQTPWNRAAGSVLGSFAVFAAFMPLFGPMFAQRALRDTLDRLDIFKATPVPGWQVAFGQLLTPVVLITGIQWTLLAVGLVARAATGVAVPPFSAATLFAVVLLTPPLAMLMLCVPFAGLLWFPAWASAISSRGGGFEVAGQRMAFGLMFMLSLALSLLPAVLVGGGLWALGALLDWAVAGQVAGTIAAAAIVATEAAYAVRALGRRIEAFDLSLESR